MTEPAPSYPAPGYTPPPGYPPAAYPPPRAGYPTTGFTPPAYGFPPPPPPVAADGTPLAEAWERFVAILIDGVIVGAISVIPVIAVFVVIFGRMTDRFNQFAAAGPDVNPFVEMRPIFELELVGCAILLPITFAISYLYFVTAMHRTGQTVGKRTMKIKVVRATDGSRISLAMARKRWVVAQPAGTMAPYFQYADALWLLWDKPYRQCLHDKCADTVVVKIKP